MYHSLADTEKTFSGLTDGCAKAGKAGCKLIEITGDNASGDDVKTLLNYAHDVTPIYLLDRVIQLTFFSILGHPRAVSWWLSSSRSSWDPKEYDLRISPFWSAVVDSARQTRFSNFCTFRLRGA